MSDYHDGISKLWIIRTPRATLDLSGYKDEHEAIDHLIRFVLTWSKDVEAEKAKLLATVEHALKHMDEKPEHRLEEADGDG